MYGLGQPDADRQRAAASGPITGTISTKPAKQPMSSQYGRPIAQNSSESDVATMSDDQRHAADVCAELEVDQQPRVAHDLSFRAW